MTCIDACLYNGTVSVLVNKSLSLDFEMQNGLRQGNPLSPFIYALVVEGMARLMLKAAENGDFKGFKMIDDVDVHLLQFTEDTVLVRQWTWNILWGIKAFLRGFKLASGLDINLSKSSLMGIHIVEPFMQASSCFSYCERGKVPFNFLGIPIEANHGNRILWNYVVKNLKSRLAVWKSRFLSIGGRITLINTVINSIPIYYLSFFKILKNYHKKGGYNTKEISVVRWFR